MPLSRRMAVLLVVVAAACRPSKGPPPEIARQVAETIFERAAKGGEVPVNIPFTGQGPATPKLLKTEVNPLTPGVGEDGSEIYHYDVKLTYLNRIQQMEHANFRFGFVKKDGVWMPWYPKGRPK